MLFLDSFTLIMIIVCVVYCALLHRKIQDLKNSRVDFTKIIKDLNVSVAKAENNINHMNELGANIIKKIETNISEAKLVNAEIQDSTKNGVEIANFLSDQINEAINTEKKSRNFKEKTYEDILNVRGNEKFSEEDLAESEEDQETPREPYKSSISHLKSKFRSGSEQSRSDKLNYYDALRRVRTPK